MAGKPVRAKSSSVPVTPPLLPLLPWQQETAARLAEAMLQQRLPHALLLSGPPGVGKRRLAEWLIALLLCDLGQAKPCGRCRGCTLLRAGSHPDLRRAGLEDDSKQIRIDAIREVIRFTLLHSQFGGRRVVLVSPADRLNRNAANTLLKTLEEPPPGAQILLVADQPAALPQTIRSRCQQLVLTAPVHAQALSWLAGEKDGVVAERLLAITANAPLRALELAEQGGDAAFAELVQSLAGISGGKVSPVMAATAWPKDRLPLFLDLLTTSVQLLIRRESTGRWDQALTELQQVPGGLELTALHGYLDYIYATQRLRDRALQPLLYVEDLFIRWQQASRQPQA